MEKKQLAYWASTGVLCLAMLGGGTADLLRHEMVRTDIVHLGYPVYLLSILGAGKLSAAIVVALPKLPRLKEWAYAGIAIDLVGATISHVVVGDPAFSVLRPVIVLSIAMSSYFLRPDDRRLA